jgi:hypothetical protein
MADSTDEPLTLLHWLLVDGSLMPRSRRPPTYGVLRRLAAERNAKGAELAAARRRKAEAKTALDAEVRRLKSEFEAEFGGGKGKRKGKDENGGGDGGGGDGRNGGGDGGGDGQADGGEEGGGTGVA